jgi:hypothetical protein
VADDIAKAFSGLSLKDIKVDSTGVIRIVNPNLASKIADMKGAFDVDALSDSLNTGTCNNTACLAPGLDRLARPGR